GGDEVDAGVGSAAVVGVEVATAGQAVAELGGLAGVAAPEAPDRVAVAAVPFRPGHGEVADLVAAGADVPGLRDELHLGEHGVLVDDVEEGAEAVRFVQAAGEGGSKVEAEAVDVHLQDPVA